MLQQFHIMSWFARRQIESLTLHFILTLPITFLQTLTNNLQKSRSTQKCIKKYRCLSIYVWVFSIIVTLPIFILADVVKLQYGTECKIKWTFKSKEKCTEIVQKTESEFDCGKSNTFCGANNFDIPMANYYWLSLTVVLFLAPILIVIFAYSR